MTRRAQHNIDIKEVVEEWIAAGLVEKRQEPDGTIAYRVTGAAFCAAIDEDAGAGQG